MKLHLGCGKDIRPGYINIDLYDPEAEVQADALALPYPDNSVDEIISFQFIEHLPYNKTSGDFDRCGDDFFIEAYRVLKPGGTMITECPDIEYTARQIVETGTVDYTSMISLYGEYFRPWDKERFADWERHAGAVHINAFTFGRIQDIARRVGFTVERLTVEQMDHRYQYEQNLAVRWTK